ncbi:MAG: hypothetical protein E7366_00250 [Clostridiales bacterium]|nr:hypothetical protein [Clostridiales bacterium]
MSDRFTAEQRAAIEAEGRTIVSASAGSGKTTVMIEKIIRLIKSGCNVDEILAVTFTKKAAAQMKEKLCKVLIEEINKPETTAEKRAELKKQLSNVPAADISTIHSFCTKLIRTNFFKAGVDNGFRVIGGDDAEGTALKNEALNELLEEAYEEKNPQFSLLLSVYWRKKSDNALRRIFLTSYEELRNRSDYREYLTAPLYDEHAFNAVCEDLFALLKEKCNYYFDLIQEELTWFDENGGGAQLTLATQLTEYLSGILIAPDYFAACKEEKPTFAVNRTSKKDTEEKKRHAAKIAFLKDKVVQIHDELKKTASRHEELQNFLYAGEVAKALSVYLLKFDEKYERLKGERGVLDFNDLEHKALALLADKEITEETRKKYRYVFVDEYQDVNPVQEALISRLSGDNLFLVGDVKQSIYGFRGSKSKFFVEKQKAFAEGEGQNLAMTRNFRSSDAVLDAVNSQFALAMTPQTVGLNYAADSHMEKGGRYEVNSGRVQIHFMPEPEKEEKADRDVYSVKAHTGKKTTEESIAAKTIHHIIEMERRSKIYDADRGEYREVRYSDIAVLSRKKKGQIATTVAALAAEGVPVTAAAAVNVCDYAEVKTLIDILLLIDNAEQDVPLCSALLSAMGNMTADELTEIRLAYKEEPFFRKACKNYLAEKSDEIAYKLSKFYEYYEKVRNLSRVLPAGELLTQILTETRMEARLLSKENGVACLKRIHRFIEESASGEPLSVHAFLARLRDLDYKIEYSENGGEDSVKVLTIHSSKGLEYPIVILDNLSAPFRLTDHDEVFVEETYGLAPRAFNEEKMTKSNTLLRRLHETKQTANSIADELNLYYVALTRAKYGLHLLFQGQPKAMADAKYAKSFEEFTDFGVWEQYVVEDEFFDLPKQDRKALVFRPNEVLTRKIMSAFLWEYPFAGYENFPVKSSATQLMDRVRDERNEKTDDVDVAVEQAVESEETENELSKSSLFENDEWREQAETGIASGLAYHAFLERFDFSRLYEGEQRAQGERLKEIVELAYAEEKAKEEIDGFEFLSLEKLQEILSNRIFGELQGMRLYKEQQFLVNLPIKDTYALQGNAVGAMDDKEEILFQGAIDLLAIGEDKKVRIVDYKYSSGGAEYLKSHYQPQLDLYKKATAKILKLPLENIQCTIVNIYRGFQVDMD